MGGNGYTMNDLGRYFALVYSFGGSQRPDSDACGVLTSIGDLWDGMAQTQVIYSDKKEERVVGTHTNELRAYARHCAKVAHHIDFATVYSEEHKGERIDGVAYITSATMDKLTPLRWKKTNDVKGSGFTQRAVFYGLSDVTVELAFYYVKLGDTLALEARLQTDLDEKYSGDSIGTHLKSPDGTGATTKEIDEELRQIKAYMNLSADLFHPPNSNREKPLSVNLYLPRSFDEKRQGYDLRADFLGLLTQ